MQHQDAVSAPPEERGGFFGGALGPGLDFLFATGDLVGRNRQGGQLGHAGSP